MTSEQPAPRADRLRLRDRSPVTLIAGLSLGILILLVALGLNGSSLSLLHTSGSSTSGIVLGHARGIRSDEFQLSTPLTIGNAIRGLPTTAQVGLTQTYLPAIGNLAPTSDWTTVFRLDSLGWLFLPLANAFALHWWLPIVIGLIGLTWLLRELGVGRGASMLLAIAGIASPIVAWWSLGPANVLGYGALTTAAALRAARTTHWRPRTLWALSAAYWLCCFALILYPPWQVCVAWILLGAFVGTVIDRRSDVRALAHSLAVTAVVAVTILLLWYAESRSAIKALAATIYPGHRVTHSGGAVPGWLESASFYIWPELHNLAISGKARTPSGVITAANLSEVSSAWLPAAMSLVVIAALLITLWRRSENRDAAAIPDEGVEAPELPALRWTATGIAVATLLNLVWAYVPGVDLLGHLTLLDRVEGPRAPLAIGLGALLLLALATEVLPGRLSLPWRVALAVAVILDLWWAVATSRSVPWVANPPSPAVAVLGGSLLAAAYWGSVSSRRLWGVGLLAGLAIATTVLVNPLVHGLGPLRTDPVIRLLAPIAKTPTNHVVAIGPMTISDLANASGADVLSGLTYYPDVALWQALDPKQSGQWNNFAKYQWVYDPTATPVRIKPLWGTVKLLQVNLCDPQLGLLHIDWVLSNQTLPAPCLSLTDVSGDGKGKDLYLYRRTA